METLGTLKTSVCCNDWKIPKAKLTVVADGFRLILLLDLFDQPGIKIWGKCYCPKTEVNAIETPCLLKQLLAKKISYLISELENLNTNRLTQNFKNYRVIHQKRRKVPIHFQPKVKIELEKFLNEGHIEILSNCSYQFFISPIVITVKKDHSNKMALDSKILNKAIHKNKYQMPTIDPPIQTLSLKHCQPRRKRRLILQHYICNKHTGNLTSMLIRPAIAISILSAVIWQTLIVSKEASMGWLICRPNLGKL